MPDPDPTQPNARRGGFLAHAASLVLLVLILLVDTATSLGYAEWALYLVPVGLTLFQRRQWVPFALAAGATLFSALGVLLSPPGVDPAMAIVNRAVGAFSLWVLAFVIWQVLRYREQVQALLWLQQGETAVAQRLLGAQSAEQIGQQACAALCELLQADVGVLYRLDERPDGAVLWRSGGHAFEPATAPAQIPVPQGLVGETARDGRIRVVEGLQREQVAIGSATQRAWPRALLLAPLRADGAIVGVVELGFVAGLVDAPRARRLLDQLSEGVGIALRSALYRERLQELLAQTQRQGEALQAQQEELRVSNEELEEQSRVLRASQAQLETQQTELEQTNVQLEEHTQSLERQKRELLIARQTLERNAQSLEAASRYKSEFLANMSHELRTPLNSSLILAKLLGDNRDGNLSDEQVRYARAIHASNNDLLVLINDILDLSKIEAGHLELNPEPITAEALVARLRTTFEPIALQKRLGFRVELPPASISLNTDPQRLQQVLTNLLANAFKFTEQGQVTLNVRPVAGGRVAFAVTDTGIGIAASQQDIIFEAFRQADGSTSRRFGGTGLGLSISRELAHRLGGEIRVDSEPGRGSTFTLEVAQVLTVDDAAAAKGPPVAPPVAPPASPAPTAPPLFTPPAVQVAPAVTPVPSGPRPEPGRAILVVEDDERFARVLQDLGTDLGFDCVVATNGREALQLARELQPTGILLDIGLPDESGLSVLERLKRDPATRHIPVHMMSAHEREQTALELGAIGYLLKPAARDELANAVRKLQARLPQAMRHLLIVEDDESLRRNLELLLGAQNVEITAVGTIAAALEQLARQTFDCMVMDLSLPDGSGYDLLEAMSTGDKYSFPPVITYTGRALSRDEELRLRKYSKSIIVKGARSPERLLDEVTLFLHSVEASLPSEQQRLLKQARHRDAVLDGRQVLLAEDDVRNIFALTSVLEPLGVTLVIARNGREAIEQLERRGDSIDLVLMDIMMPEMDGITALQRIRERPEWASLPIIALTAKAMSDDRERCLAAGASDYMSKPIDVDKLVSLCRVWMPK